MINFRISYYDMTTGLFMFSRTQAWPEARAYVPGLPVRIECVECFS